MLALTLFLRIGEHFSAVHAGLTVVPFSLGTALTAPVAASQLERFGGRLLVQFGVGLSLVGYVTTALLIANPGHVSSWALLGPLAMVGFGMGFFVVCAFNTMMAAVTDEELGSASGALNAIQQLGSAVGVAVLGSVFFSVLTHHGFHPALSRVMWWSAGAMVIAFACSVMLPRQARTESDLLGAQ